MRHCAKTAMQSVTVVRLSLLAFMHMLLAMSASQQPQQPHKPQQQAVYPTDSEFVNDILPTLSYTFGGNRK